MVDLDNITDMRGSRIHIGDEVVFGRRSGNNSELIIAEVVEFVAPPEYSYHTHPGRIRAQVTQRSGFKRANEKPSLFDANHVLVINYAG